MLPCPALILLVIAVRFFSDASSCRALSGLLSSCPSVPLPLARPSVTSRAAAGELPQLRVELLVGHQLADGAFARADVVNERRQLRNALVGLRGHIGELRRRRIRGHIPPFRNRLAGRAGGDVDGPFAQQRHRPDRRSRGRPDALLHVFAQLEHHLDFGADELRCPCTAPTVTPATRTGDPCCTPAAFGNFTFRL